MPRLSLWNPKKNNDYWFFDRLVREQFIVGGTDAIVHKYLGPEENAVKDEEPDPLNETTIQDLLFLENRDRKYEQDLYTLRGHYNVSDNDFDLTQFGIFLTNDTLYMTFHMNHMVEIIGRKLISGDVLELPHLIEEFGLDADTPPIPKFYTVTDGNRGSEGFSPTWWPHLWRVKIEPITDSQEFSDILGNADDEDSMKHILSTFDSELNITSAVVKEAAENNPDGTYLIDHLRNYVLENGFEWKYDETNPPDGDSFPMNPNQGDVFIRNDYKPNRLFIYRDRKWVRLYDNIEDRTWSNKTFNAASFINNQETDVAGGKTYDSRQSITDAILPRDDIADKGDS